MKKLFSVLMVALTLGAMVSCNNGGAGNKSAASKTEDSISTEMGKFIGTNLKAQMAQDPRAQEELDKAELLRGIEAVLNCDTQGINIDRRAFINEFKKAFNSKDSVDMATIQNMQPKLMAMIDRATKAKGAENDKEGQKYIADQMKKDKGFKKTASGIAYKVVKQGTGANFNDSATVDVVYVGRHVNGKEFDNSKGKPVPFNLKMTVPGFREIISLMNPGSKVIAIIPGALAYGEQGNPQGGIGPNETLEFEITAQGIHKEDPTQMPGRPVPAPAPSPAPKKPAKK